MDEHLQEKLPQLERLCRRFLVKRLEVFGSVATDRFDPGSSDLDFLVEYLPEARQDRVEAYFGLKLALEELFGREVDLVEREAIRNPYFREETEATKVLVYAA